LTYLITLHLELGLKSFSTDTVEKHALQHAKKVSLTAAQDYDVMVLSQINQT
jgi:hypothetical protein